MNALPSWLVDHPWTLALSLVAFLLAGLAAIFRRRSFAFSLLLAAGIVALLIPGAFLPRLSWLLLLSSLAGLVVLALVLLISGGWSRHAGLVVGVGLLLGLGGTLAPAGNRLFAQSIESLTTLRLREPWWLVLLALLPFTVFLSWRRLTRQELRPWLALSFRLAGITVLGVAMAEPYFIRTTDDLTVIFVVDRSLSIPEEPGVDGDTGEQIDLRWKRIRTFINRAVQLRGRGHERDRAGLIIFGRKPRLELLPTDASRFALKEIPAADDGTHTDIAAALKLALASFTEGSARRIVLISDGNETLGNAEEQARLAKSLGVEIDVLPLAAGKPNLEEIQVERVVAHPFTEQGARIPIRVLVRSHNPNIVVGKLILYQFTDKDAQIKVKLDDKGTLGIKTRPVTASGASIVAVAKDSPAARAGLGVGDVVLQLDGKPLKGAGALELALTGKKPGTEVMLSIRRKPIQVRDPAFLKKGLNAFTFDQSLGDDQRSYTYEAEFQPRQIVDKNGKVLQNGLPRDRIENNVASTHVLARGRGRILVLEDKAGQHEDLVSALVQAGKRRFKVVAEPVDILDNYKDSAKLAVFLSNFDCVILANVPADRITETQQEVIRRNTHDQGCGLVMIGGPASFGAGGWQNTPVEKALPVDSDIKSLKVQGMGGLVMIMHASEMAQGNMWQKKIARLAVERLGPIDEVGILLWDGNTRWHVPMTRIQGNKAKILARIDKMVPMDMPDFDPPLQQAHQALMDKKKDYSAKHVIIISDGDPNCTLNLLPPMKADKITVTTVGVATHGANEDGKMAKIAKLTGGRYYGPRTKPGTSDPKNLPAIYIKETRLVAQSFVHRKPFTPQVLLQTGPMARLPDKLLPLNGFVRTSPKPSPLVELPIITPRFADQTFPLLAHWRYGLGRSAAFTSDAGLPERWSLPWLKGGGRTGIYDSFWEQLIAWVQRPAESGKLTMMTTYRDGKIHIVIKTEEDKADTVLRLRAGLTPPNGKPGDKPITVKFTPKSSGVYEAEVKAEEAGSYFINAQATRVRQVKGRDGKMHEVEEPVDSVRGGVSLPYSREFADLESNITLLERIRELTGGNRYEDDADALDEVAQQGVVFRRPEMESKSLLPFETWLLFLACVLLLVDVAFRRLAFDRAEAAQKASYVWARLRGFPLPPPIQASAGRLQGRGEVLAGAERRFEGVPASALPVGTVPPKLPPAPSQGTAMPPPPEQGGGTMDALMAAKRRALEQRKKDGDAGS